jgi:hypothetical protein
MNTVENTALDTSDRNTGLFWALVIMAAAVCIRFGFDVHDRWVARTTLDQKIAEQKLALERSQFEVNLFRKIASRTAHLAAEGNDSARSALANLEADRSLKIRLKNQSDASSPPAASQPADPGDAVDH